MPYIDGGIVSFKAGMTKPDPRMFRLFLDQYALSPETCVFIDDASENVKAAQDLGFSGIIFTSYEALPPELKELGVSL